MRLWDLHTQRYVQFIDILKLLIFIAFKTYLGQTKVTGFYSPTLRFKIV